MRDISQSLLRGQREPTILAKHLLIQAVLTYGATTLTYTTTKIKKLSDIEQVWSHKGQLLLDDSDKTLHSLDLEGYKAVLSYGLITRAGAELVTMPPMWVVGQDRDSYRDRLECYFELEGIFNRMGRHKAEDVYTQESGDSNTVKTLLTGIAEATLSPYTNYPAYTIIFDSIDDLIDTFIPADGFKVALNETRLSKFKELMSYTDCVARIGSDEAIHISVPVTSGTAFNNEYTLQVGRDFQNFFNKRFRRRIVSPNYFTFKSNPDTDGYSGFAKDASADLDESSGGNGSMLERETRYARVVSDAQCVKLANALLLKKQMEAEKGSFVLPFVHFGQELYDYVNVIDARAGDSRAGNIGHISRQYEPGRFNMSAGYGRVPVGVPALRGIASELGKREGLSPEADFLFNQVFDFLDQMIDVIGDKVDQAEYDEYVTRQFFEAFFIKATVSRELNIPSEAA